jgi:hypothetical protein
MNRINKALLCSAFFCHNLYADCLKPVQYTLKGEVAQCSGFLFSPQKELEVRISVEENKVLKQELELNKKLLDNYRLQVSNLEHIYSKESEKTELWRVRAEDSTKKLIESESGRGNRDLLFLIGGVALTIASGYALHLAATN